MEIIMQAVLLKPLLVAGLVLGLIVRTLGPWLLKGAARGPFKPKYHWNWVIAAAVGFVPTVLLLSSTGNVWGDLVYGAAVAFGMQAAVREFITKLLEKPAAA